MKATNTSDVLEKLVTTCLFPGQDARDMPDALRCASDLLREEGVAFAVAGRVALARYSPAQFTNRLVLRLAECREPGRIVTRLRAQVGAALRAASGIELRMGFTVAEAERRFIATASITTWLHAQVPVASAGHLLLLACMSWSPEDRWDAINVLQSGHVDWPDFLAIAADDRLVLRRAEYARRDAARHHASYSEMIDVDAPTKHQRRSIA